MNVFGFLLAAAGGFCICLINYTLSKHVLLKNPKLFSAFTVIRQVLNVAYLVLCYFAAPLTPFDLTILIIGAALGITLPMFYFTGRLLKLTDAEKQRLNDQSKQEE